MKSLNGRRTSDRNLASCLRETIEAIGSAVANVVCVLNPHAVIVSGRYALFGDYFVKRLQAATERRLIDNLKRDLLFLPSS